MTSIRTLVVAALTALAFNAFAAIDVNRANQAELETVKGIGPALSSKILEARKAGTFRDWTDLVERVQGVGPASAARLSTQGLTVGGAAFTPPAAQTERQARAPRADVQPGSTPAPARTARAD